MCKNVLQFNGKTLSYNQKLYNWIGNESEIDSEVAEVQTAWTK